MPLATRARVEEAGSDVGAIHLPCVRVGGEEGGGEHSPDPPRAVHSGRIEGVVQVDTTTLIPSPTARAQFGHAISARRDLDGDGIADIIVGAPGWSTGAGRTGAVLFFRGDIP